MGCARTAAIRSPKPVSRRCPGRRCASTARAIGSGVDRAAPLAGGRHPGRFDDRRPDADLRRRAAARRQLVRPVGLGLVIGGSVSNLTDRVRLGHVTDFLDFKYWPAFNLADTFIVVGVAALLLALVASDRQSSRPQRVREATRS